MIATILCLVPLFAGDDLAALDKKMRSADERERRAAVQELAGVGSKEAWLRVIEALADASPEVADEAEIQLAKLSDAELLPELCGKKGLAAKDPWVQAHAAGAVGSLTGLSVPAEQLVPGLESKYDDVRSILCAGIESLARAGKLENSTRLTVPLLKSAKRDVPGVQAAALLALEQVLPDPQALPVAQTDREPAEVTCARMRIAAGRGTSGREHLQSGARSAERSVRAQVVELLAAQPDAWSLGLLVDMLEKEKNARLAWTIDGELERLSGLSGGGKPAFWRDWIDHLGADWKPVSRDKKPREPKGDTAVAQLAGMPIVSDHLVILVDFSGSTWEKREGGKTRKDQLDAELKKTLEALPEGTMFNVVPYTLTPIPWEKTLQPATSANVQKALKFFTGCKASGKGNFWDAAMLALDMPDVDTILVLTDGAPTGGHRWNIDLMQTRYVERNRFLHVALDAVIVDAKKGMENRWRRFCEATGGRMLPVDMK